MPLPTRRPEVEVTLEQVRGYLTKLRMPRTQENITWGFNQLTWEEQEKRLPAGRTVVEQQRADAPRTIVYGRTKLEGLVSWFAMHPDNSAAQRIVTFTGCEVEDIEELWLDDWRVDFGNGVPGYCTVLSRADGQFILTETVYLQKNLGASDQAALTQPVSLGLGWTEAHRQRGCSHAYVGIVWDKNIFGDGLPKVSAVIKGKPLYDPRTEETAYSANPVLAICDVITNAEYGLGEPWSNIDLGLAGASANACDETVNLGGGGTEFRYQVNGSFSTEEDPFLVIAKLAGACAGTVRRCGGIWRIYAGAYIAPVVTLTEADVIGELTIQTMRPRKESCNRVRGTFPDATRQWETTDYPPVKNAIYLGQDAGVEIWQNLDLPFTSSQTMAQRLAKIEMEKARQGITVSGVFGLRALDILAGETVAFTLSRMGWTSKVFLVEEWELVELHGAFGVVLGVGLVLRETASAIYDWNEGEETTWDLAPNTGLPAPWLVPTPAGLIVESGTDQLYKKADGTIMSRMRVSWTAPTDASLLAGGSVYGFVKRSSASTWETRHIGEASQTEFFVFDVEDGALYDIKVQYQNSFGFRGTAALVENHQVIGKTAPPEDVTGLTATLSAYGTELNWNPVSDIDLLEYVLKVGASWAAGTVLGRLRSTTYMHKAVVAGSYTYRIKARDTSKNESENETTLAVTIAAPTLSEGVAVFAGEDVEISWTEATAGNFALADYAVYMGATFGTATLLAAQKGTTFKQHVSWTGARNYWIVARDIAGNSSAALLIQAVVTPPGAVSALFAKVINNNVIIDWAQPSVGTLPIAGYRVLKGAVYASAVLQGTINATYTALFEMAGGVFHYHVAAVDSAGNVGTHASVETIVNEPANFVLKYNQALTITENELTDMVLEGSAILGPADTDETYQEHFAAVPDAALPDLADLSIAPAAWFKGEAGTNAPTWQDQIDAGFDYWLEPAPEAGSMQAVVDLGASISGVLITLDWVQETIDGAPTVTPEIEHSADNSTWTSLGNVSQAYCAASFQYLRLTLAVSGSGNDDLVRISNARVKVAVHIIEEEGESRHQTSDSGGTEITFEKEFIDVIGTPEVFPVGIRRAAKFLRDSSHYLSHADADAFSPLSSAFTLTAMIRVMRYPPSSNMRVLAKWESYQMEYLVFIGPAGDLGIYYSSDLTFGTAAYITADEFGPLPLNEWCAIAAYWNTSTNKIGIKVNNVPATEASFSAGFGNGTGAFTVGGTTATFDGLICNVLWIGECISEANLDALYDLGIYDYSDLSATYTTNIRGAWLLDEASGTRQDASGNNRDLTSNNSTPSAIIPTFGLADFTDEPYPTDFKALIYTDSLRRVSQDFKHRTRGVVKIS